MVIETSRLRLRPWTDADAPAFASLNADPEVMADLGGPLDRGRSDAKLARYRAAFDRLGFCRWAVAAHDGDLLGYCGIQPAAADHPLGEHVEIGWRLHRAAWGSGYASEAARAALGAYFADHVGPVLSYTAPDNLRSQAVMVRLGLRRDPDLDFVSPSRAGVWSGLVWVADPAT